MYDAATPVQARESTGGPSTLLMWAGKRQAEGCDDATTEAALDAEEWSLVQAARQDRTAFAPLYRRYIIPIYRYFYQHVATREDAEDLTAGTFSKALVALHRYEARGSFAAWLFGIARHTLMDHQRALYARDGLASAGEAGGHIDLHSMASPLADTTLGPEAQVLLSEQATYLRHLVAALPDEQREALVLRIFGELRTRDVATILGKSEGAVKMLVHRAVATLRARYKPDGQETR